MNFMFTSKSARCLAMFGMIGMLFTARLSAQETTFTVFTDFPKVQYTMDGQLYTGSNTFIWPAGSKHTILLAGRNCDGTSIPGGAVQYDPFCSTRYTVAITPLPYARPGPPGIITADPEIKSLTLTASVEYLLRASFFDVGSGPSAPVSPPATPCLGLRPPSSPETPALVCVDEDCHLQSFDKWVLPGQHSIAAYPYDGYVFTGWDSANGSPGPTISAYLSVFNVRGPAVLVATFAPAKRVQIYTDPVELKILVDRAEIQTVDPAHFARTCPMPGYFDFAENSTHILSAPPSQRDSVGKLWVLDSWSNGGGLNMEYRVTKTNIPEVLTAKFVPGTPVSFVVNPGLKLIVDSRDTWPSLNFIWGVGSKHTVTAPAEQFDSNGRKYIFKGWSNAAAASQEVVVNPSAPELGMRLTAEYEMLGMLVVQANSDRVSAQVDGQVCATPCTVHRSMGVDLRINVPETFPLLEGSRLEFTSLGGGASPVKTLKLGSEPVIVLASYRTTYKIAATAYPPNGADIRMDPASPDAFYPANSRVQVFSSSRPGYRFKRWEGDTADRFSPATVTVSGPLQLRAVLEAVPEISQAGVRNGAGETPVSAVAPGSIISVYGASLAPASEAGPLNPLTQTIAGVTVQVAGHILPLFFVSPGQINAQLPFDLPVGTQTLAIKNRDMPDVTATFEVVRNAPGLITSLQGGRMVVAAIRTDGSAVSAGNPVKPGELLTLFGTGFGPHRVPVPEGFAVDELDAYRLVDPVQIDTGNQLIVPEYAGAAAGLPGLVALRFRVPSSLSGDAVINVTALVSGVKTNSAVLPTAAAYSANAEQNEP